MRIDRGTIVLSGVRPCVVISDPEVSGDQRYPVLCVVPITRTAGEGALYPLLSPGPGGLRDASHALVDQLRAVDKRRVRRVFGQVKLAERQAIDEGLRLYLGLSN